MKISNDNRSVIHWRNACGALLVCVATAGCIRPMGPDYKRPNVTVPDNWRVDLTDAADITNTNWWKTFGDQNLDRLIDEALRANNDLLIATAHVEAYEGKTETTNSQFFPQIGADAGYERDMRSQEVPELLRPGQPPTFNQFKGLLTISYEFDLWGRVRRSYEASRAELLSTQDARHTVMLTVVSDVASTYFQLLQEDRELELACHIRDSWKSSWDLTDKKFHGGSATDIDVAVAQANYQEEVALIPDIERRVAILEDSLSTLLGRNPAPVIRSKMSELSVFNVPAGIPADVLTRRPDILAAEQDLVAANARIGIAKTEYFPTFSLTSSYGQSSDMTRWLLAKTARTGDLAIDLVGPIFTFGKVEGDVKAARAETREQQYKYLQTVQTALREVDDSLVANEKTRVRDAALVQHTAMMRNVDDLTRTRFKGGSSTDLDVYTADRSLYAAQMEENVAQGDELLALVSVFKAMGGGWMQQEDKVLASKERTASTQAVDKTPPSSPSVTAN